MDASRKPMLRRLLDRVYQAAGALAAICLAGTCLVMLAQVVGRETGVLLRGADDVVAWLCAGSAFLALGYTFRSGEMVRMSLVIERLSPSVRRGTEVLSLAVATLFTGYMAWSVANFVYESWKFNEVAQGLLKIPIWIPQLSFLVGVVVFFVAVLDEFLTVLAGRKPEYLRADEERRARNDFSDSL